jgi:hypothetical protein
MILAISPLYYYMKGIGENAETKAAHKNKERHFNTYRR